MDSLGLTREHVRVIEDQYTAQAFITTDVDDNQITAFHPGAMSFSHRNTIASVPDATLAITAPDGYEGMMQHARDLKAAAIPYVFDPGQGLPMYSREDLAALLSGASVMTVNDYEMRIVEQKTGETVEEIAARVGAVIVTKGGEGSTVYTLGRQEEIAPVAADRVVDPTGCGDAFRAGLLYGMARQWPWARCARLGSLMGSIKIAHKGGQNHKPTLEEIAWRLKAAFGDTL
jgi:adenosine kinase